MESLKYDEVTTDTGAKRTLKLNGNAIAVAYVDWINIGDPHFTLWWPLNDDVSFYSIMDHWLTKVLPENGIDPNSVPTTLEFWVSGDFHETELPRPVSGHAVFSPISMALKGNERLEHVLLNSLQRVVEFTVEDNILMRCFCSFQKVTLPALDSFFQMYHESANVRSQTGTLEEANKTLDFFSPVPVNPS
jgi:hypothetical protein